MRGRFLIIDGPDGAGKGVFLEAMRAAAAAEGKRVFDLHAYWREHGCHPSPAAFADAAVLLSSEPTYVGAGKRIREELIRKSSHYSAREIAEAYAADRQELYERVLLPALDAGMTILQSRGVTTSLVYQLLDAARKGESLRVEDVAGLPGNAFCLSPAALPDVILILTVSEPEELMRRLAKREKQDKATFETLAFQRRVREAFESEWFRRFFEDRGVRVVFADAATSIAASQRSAVQAYHELRTLHR